MTSSVLTHDEIMGFMSAYNMPAYGWYVASLLHRAGWERFPVFPERKLRWVHLAWLLLTWPDVYGQDRRFLPIKEACAIHGCRDNNMRDVIEAALISIDATIPELARRLTVPAPVLEAYDALFFNVIDRKHDRTFIRNIVYPNNRLEEMVEDNITKGNMSKVLLRFGYNKGMNEVLYFSGYHYDIGGGLNSSQATELFQREVMVQGYLLASNGFLNYQKQHVSVSTAKAILQANKIGGVETGGDTSVGVFSDFMATQLEADGEKMRASARRLAGVD